MAHLIDIGTLMADIAVLQFATMDENRNFQTSYDEGRFDALTAVDNLLDTIEVKEVDLELITGWFDHIAQIADDRMTLTNQRMTDAHALDEIKCLAKNSSEFITKHYKAQKGE